MNCPDCGSVLAENPQYISPWCWTCQAHKVVDEKKLVWVRTRTVSYSAEVLYSDLQPDGKIKGQDAWWEPWPGL